MAIERVNPLRQVVHRTLGYLVQPGGGLKAVGISVALGAAGVALFGHTGARDLWGALGAAVMIWWLGFQVREKADRED